LAQQLNFSVILVRTVGMVRLDDILFKILSKKWHQH